MTAIIGFLKELKAHPKIPEAFSFAWLEGTLEARLVRWDGAKGWDDPEKWHSGRLFGEKCEYRWERKPDGAIHSVMIEDAGALPEGFAGRIEITEIEGPGTMLLWGEWVDPDRDPKGNPDKGPVFYDRSIPSLLAYPVDLDAERQKGMIPCLTTRRYRAASPSGGIHSGEFIRCVSVCMKGKEDANGADQSL